MQFGHEVIDNSPTCGRPDICQPADLTENGRPDIYAAKTGFRKRKNKSQNLIFSDQGDGEFKETLINRGTPLHEANAINMNDNGGADVVGNSYCPDYHVDIWYNEG